MAPHRDVSAVEAALSARDEERAVVVTDSVFSADGVLAPLRALHDVCRRHGALLIVDEAVRGSNWAERIASMQGDWRSVRSVASGDVVDTHLGEVLARLDPRGGVRPSKACGRATATTVP